MLDGAEPDSATAQAIQQLGAWAVAFDEADPPTLNHFLFPGDQPIVYARVEYLTQTRRDQMSLDGLRDAMFPVSESGRQSIDQQLAAAEKAGQPQFFPLKN